MNTGIVKSKASGLALMGKVLVMGVVLGSCWVPKNAQANAADTQFVDYLFNVCNTLPTTVTDLAKYANVCALQGGGLSGPGTSLNMGTFNSGGIAASRNKKDKHDRLEESKKNNVKGASADDGGWGVLVSPQYGKSDRVDTYLENGYQSILKGLVLGVDRRYSDNIIVGFSLGQTADDATFLHGGGALKNRSNTATIYGTWMLSAETSVDGYLGLGKLNIDNQRHIVISPTISGINSGSTTGKQVMAGLSIGHQANIGKANFSPSLGLDYIKTSIKGYRETGSNFDADSLALRFGDREVVSFTGNIGGKFSRSYGFEWGALIPGVNVAAVHEFQNKSRQISNELVITPGTSFLVQTDSPDRNYLNLGLSVVAAMNGGAQLFLDYEKRTQDRLLRSWAVSLGGLFEF
jgi:uncharacterized protein YhjY with autotransporter beta-barrel domain